MIARFGPTAGISAKFGLPSGHGTLRDTLGDNQLFAIQSAPTHSPQATSARGCLQKLFGFNPVLAQQEAYQILGERRLVYPQNIKAPSEGYDRIYDYRYFVLKAHLDPYVLGRTYKINIGFNALDSIGQNAISGRIGSVVVLLRFDDTQFDACQGNRNAGIKSPRSIMIPRDITTEIALHSDEMEVVSLLHKALSAEIAFPGGKTYARTVDTLLESNKPIEEESIPEITLHSAAMQSLYHGIEHDRSQPQNRTPLTPFEPYDWQHHGTLFPASGWAAA
ncbi:hypothetical protein FRC11_012659 [Ceratobasidium sp. 423]|nr:hypothetical protein FRC11_012659 [Ceratobasidium sp. 423]